MYVSLTDLKKHLNVDHSEDDDYISELESVAEDSVATYLQVDDLTGYLVPEGERQRYEDRIVTLMQDAEKRMSMGLQALEHAQMFSRERVAEKWFQVIG